jgi:hypothetical protein
MRCVSNVDSGFNYLILMYDSILKSPNFYLSVCNFENFMFICHDFFSGICNGCSLAQNDITNNINKI